MEITNFDKFIEKITKKDDTKVHQSHCCNRHGCKYGDEGCPVVTGEVIQDYPCEICNEEKRFGIEIVLKNEELILISVTISAFLQNAKMSEGELEQYSDLYNKICSRIIFEGKEDEE